MKWVRSSILLLLTFFLLCGSFGMLIFKHSCNQEGVSFSYFIHSGNHTAVDNLSNSCSNCCSNESKKHNCCQDEISYFKIKLDFVSYEKIHVPNAQIFKKDLIFFEPYISIIACSRLKFNKKYPPPIISGNEILIRHQVFRI